MKEPAKNGTTTKLIGLSCPNPRCHQHQMLIVTCRMTCDLCGFMLKPASVSVAVFKWEPTCQSP